MVLLFPPSFTSSSTGPYNEQTFNLGNFLSSSSELANQVKEFLEGSLPGPCPIVQQGLRHYAEYNVPENLVTTPDINSKVLPRLKYKDGLLYMAQEEWAVTYPGDVGKTKIMATSDATTCHAVFIRCPVTGSTAVGHFGSHWPVTLASMIQKVNFLSRWIKALPEFQRLEQPTGREATPSNNGGDQAAAASSNGAANGTSSNGAPLNLSTHNRDSNGAHSISPAASQAACLAASQSDDTQQQNYDPDPLDLYLVGGFEDDKHLSKKLSYEFLSFFNNHKQKFRIQLCCIGPYNTTFLPHPKHQFIPSPIAYGAAMDIRTGRIFRSHYQSKGPDGEFRAMKLSFGERENRETGAHEIFDCCTGHLTIKGFHLSPYYARNPEILQAWMRIDKMTYLQQSSTSPLVEPPSYYSSSMAAMSMAYERYKVPCEYNGLEVQARVWKRQTDGDWGLF